MRKTTRPKAIFKQAYRWLCNPSSPAMRVLQRVLVLNIGVALLKISGGLLSGAVSMVADGFHSLMDGAANVVGLIALRIAQSPPDRNHPYGHRKAETLASLFIGVLLVLVAYEIFGSALSSLFDSQTPSITLGSLGVMVLTMMINIVTTTYEQRQGKALNSEILLADAAHTRSDIWVSASVLAGLIGVQLGWIWLDALVGFGIAGIIAFSSLKILRQASQTLMDHVALPQDKIEALALSLPGVESVERIRSRGRADDAYIDLHVRVKADTPTDQAHHIAHEVQRRLKTAFPQAMDVTIHIEPEPMIASTQAQIKRQLKGIALSLGVAIHDIWIYGWGEAYFVDLHLEVPASLDLEAAHTLATTFEQQGKATIPEIAAITTHIEPMGELIKAPSPTEVGTTVSLTKQAQCIAARICGPDTCHEFRLWREPNALALSLHCTLAPSLSIVDAHQVSERLKFALGQELPQLKRVMVHVEPRGLES